MSEFDCGLFLADWCVDLCGVDPAANMRGRYSTLEEALAISKSKNLVAMFHKLLRRVGVRRTIEPRCGDLAVIELGEKLRGAIVTSRGFAVVAEGGGISRPLKPRLMFAWSFRA
jgi:Domain of unknown function (DUF6950)